MAAGYWGGLVETHICQKRAEPFGARLAPLSARSGRLWGTRQLAARAVERRGRGRSRRCARRGTSGATDPRKALRAASFLAKPRNVQFTRRRRVAAGGPGLKALFFSAVFGGLKPAASTVASLCEAKGAAKL